MAWGITKTSAPWHYQFWLHHWLSKPKDPIPDLQKSNVAYKNYVPAALPHTLIKLLVTLTRDEHKIANSYRGWQTQFWPSTLGRKTNRLIGLLCYEIALICIQDYLY